VGDPRHALERIGRHRLAPATDPAERVASELATRIGAQAGERPTSAHRRIPGHHLATDRRTTDHLAAGQLRAPYLSRGPRSDLAGGPGRQPQDDIRGATERQLRVDLSQVRVHDDLRARTIASLAGARALTHRQDVFLGEGVTMTDGLDLAHELVHAATLVDDRVYARRATWVERRAWLASYDHYLPRKFLNNYMDDTGTPITLTQQEMIDCNPIVDIRRSTSFRSEVSRLQAAGGGSSIISLSGWGGALTNGTLGNFTIHWNGTLTVSPSGTWAFTGTIDFYDYWDFDPKPFGGASGRPVAAEVKVRIANLALPGRPFHIHSVRVPAGQTNSDSRATWMAAGPPRPVGDHATRTGADIAVGGAGGDVAGGAGGDIAGPDVGAGAGAEVGTGGAEVGAHSSGDLNK
jgi:hypothetical protein